MQWCRAMRSMLWTNRPNFCACSLVGRVDSNRRPRATSGIVADHCPSFYQVSNKVHITSNYSHPSLTPPSPNSVPYISTRSASQLRRVPTDPHQQQPRLITLSSPLRSAT